MFAHGAKRPAWKELVLQHPVAAFFTCTYAISWLGAVAIAAPHIARGEALGKVDGLIMFPVLLLGPSLTGVLLTWIESGQDGLRDLWKRMLRVRVALRWYGTIAIPPILIFLVLKTLGSAVSPAYAPSTFIVGALFGVPAGLFEEVGWMGYAYPRMCVNRKPFSGAILLGLLWSFWHLPVIDFLGSTTPHGTAWPAFFLSFTAAITGIRVLIAWTYVNTGSVFLSQLLHVSSTGSLVVLSPVHISGHQEALWYALYAVILWTFAGVVVIFCGLGLSRESVLPERKSARG